MTSIRSQRDPHGLPQDREPDQAGRVSLSRVQARGGKARSGWEAFAADVCLEQYELGIGDWKALIVRQVDIHGSRVKFRTSFNADKQESWVRRRKQRLAERLNARRRFPG